jgi:Xaa-Pro aminopeptidase
VSYGDRLARAGEQVEELGLGALLLTDLVNIRYLTGFTGSNAMLVVAPSASVFLTDFRYVERAQPLREFTDVRRGEREMLAELAEAARELTDGGTLGFEEGDLTVARHRRLTEELSDVELTPQSGVVEALRAVKDADEIAAVRRAAAVLEGVYEGIAEEGLIGRTEREVAWRVLERFHEAGAEGPSFDSIVASGAAGALPHAEPRDEVIGPGTLVTMDIGCVFEGYCSDCTRTFATEGDLPAELAAAYELCLEAQLAALDAVRPDAGGAAVDAVARDMIEAAGHGAHFGHGLGHGVGLAVHEAPRLAPSSSATLEPGMVVTVEPGIYLPGVGGVRIEDLVVVTADGCERLTGYPKELITTG